MLWRVKDEEKDNKFIIGTNNDNDYSNGMRK